MVTTAQKIEIARQNGIQKPETVYAISGADTVAFWVLCSFLTQETGGGNNIYGHDVDSTGYPRPFWGHGAVTKENYEAYKIERDMFVGSTRFPKVGRRMQGVGPMQLTWYTYQDQADALGGCWVFDNNVRVGAGILKGHYDDSVSIFDTEKERWHWVAKQYNGSEIYALEMDTRFATWRNLLGLKAWA